MEYPTGYSYTDGEQPVDEWDNFFNHHAQKDLDHLVSLTNTRLESGSGSNYPGSPEDGELFWRSDNSRLAIYDQSAADWREVAYLSELVQTEAELQLLSDRVDDNEIDIDNIGNQINNHETRTDNPHNVTNTQVGAPSTSNFNALGDAHNSVATAVNDHLPDYSNPHNVNATQTGALPLGGGIVTGDIQHEGIFLNENRVITPQVFVDAPVTHDKHAVTKEYVDLKTTNGGGGPWIMSAGDISRSPNTWYQNQTDHPTVVYASFSDRGGYEISISPTVEQNNLIHWDLNSTNSGFKLGTPFIVPPGWYYAVVTNEDITNLVEWIEYALMIGQDVVYN
ncbi:hypothetical protein C494_07855 [Natronorubrum bangense JCM 10635]|uniref:Uncharacterized protein n=1 Tax=Natronorubrum bangense JCM 10635 TaxID=1227500 RepID=L9WNI3_9EURY|nr:hypothetical protein C494_07855 [Natronorubrum bangense JCM 10635]